MTPTTFKNSREALRLTQKQMAKALGVKNERTIRKWESGENSVPGPAAIAVGYMVSGLPSPKPKQP